MEEKVTLPSKGLLNEKKIPIDYTLRSLDTNDERLIYGSTSDDAVDKMLANCVTSPSDANLQDLIPADKFYLLMRLRILTYGSMYYQSVWCPFCNFEGHEEVDLDTIEVVELNEGDLKLPLTLPLPVSGDKVELRVLTEGDYKSIKERAYKVSNKLKLPFSEVEYKFRKAKQISAVNGEKIDSFLAEKYFQDMSPKDSRYIDSALQSIKVGYQTAIKLKCPSCGREILVPFEMSSEFLSPTFRDIKWC